NLPGHSPPGRSTCAAARSRSARTGRSRRCAVRERPAAHRRAVWKGSAVRSAGHSWQGPCRQLLRNAQAFFALLRRAQALQPAQQTCCPALAGFLGEVGMGVGLGRLAADAAALAVELGDAVVSGQRALVGEALEDLQGAGLVRLVETAPAVQAGKQNLTI